jgi:hypothetical protein
MTEYTPKSVVVDFENRTGTITLGSVKDADEFIRKYNEYIMYKIPKFIITFREQALEQGQSMNQGMYNPNFTSMMMGFNQMSLSKEKNNKRPQ